MIRPLIQLYLALSLLTASSFANALFPAGDLFPIGGFSPRPVEDQAAGFTLAGPTYGDSRRLLEQCESLGLPMVFRVRPSINVKRSKDGLTAEALEQLRAEITAQVEAVAASEMIHSWAVSPEELRYWRSHELGYLQMAVEAIRSADPKKRPIWMYEPGHRTSQALAQVLPLMNISAKGTYPNYSGRKDERAWVRLSISEQREAIASSNPSALLFALPEMFQQPDDASPEAIRNWVRHDLYTSLLEGAQGILIYSFANRRRFHARQLYYDAHAEVARELNGPLKLGNVFLRGQVVDPPAIQLLSGPEEVELSARPPLDAPVVLPALLAKAYAWNEVRYFFLINSADRPITLRIKEDGWLPLFPVEASSDLTLAPHQVALFQSKTL